MAKGEFISSRDRETDYKVQSLFNAPDICQKKNMKECANAESRVRQPPKRTRNATLKSKITYLRLL